MAPCAEHSGMITQQANTTEAIKVIFDKLDEMQKQQSANHAIQMERILEIGNMFSITINGDESKQSVGLAEEVRKLKARVNMIIAIGTTANAAIGGYFLYLLHSFLSKADAIISIYNATKTVNP